MACIVILATSAALTSDASIPALTRWSNGALSGLVEASCVGRCLLESAIAVLTSDGHKTLTFSFEPAISRSFKRHPDKATPASFLAKKPPAPATAAPPAPEDVLRLSPSCPAAIMRGTKL